MREAYDIHGYKNQYERSRATVLKAEITERNKQDIIGFLDYSEVNGLSLARLSRYGFVLTNWAKIIGKDFTAVTMSDMVAAVRHVQSRDDYKGWTKSTYKVMLKRFFKWLHGDKSYPDVVSWIKCKPKKGECILPSNNDLLNEEEVSQLIRAAYHPRDKAFVSLLYESGCRIGELGTLRFRDVHIDEYGAILDVNGKTGQRTVRVISSTPYLVTWMQNHPRKDDAHAPLWVSIGVKSRCEIIKYSDIRKLLERLFEKAAKYVAMAA